MPKTPRLCVSAPDPKNRPWKSGRLRPVSYTHLDLCERESPDFLLLAGDVYNQEDASVSAQLALDVYKRQDLHL